MELDFSLDSLEQGLKQDENNGTGVCLEHGSGGSDEPHELRATGVRSEKSPAHLSLRVAAASANNRSRSSSLVLSELSATAADGKTPESQPSSTSNSLSPWEKWLLRKTREEIRRKKKLKQDRAEKKQAERHKREELAEKQKKVDTTYRQWFETKMEEERRGRREKRRETEQRETKEKEKQHVIEQKSKEKFAEWCSAKRLEEEERKNKEKQERKMEVEAELEQRSKAEKAYKEWLLRTSTDKTRSLSLSANHGSACSGRHHHHHHHPNRLYSPFCSTPLPAFKNPKRWVGPLDTCASASNSSSSLDSDHQTTHAHMLYVHADAHTQRTRTRTHSLNIQQRAASCTPMNNGHNRTIIISRR